MPGYGCFYLIFRQALTPTGARAPLWRKFAIVGKLRKTAENGCHGEGASRFRDARQSNAHFFRGFLAKPHSGLIGLDSGQKIYCIRLYLDVFLMQSIAK